MVLDLDFIESFAEGANLSGGVYTQVYGTAQTGYGGAFATINSVASGEQTYTWGNTSTNITNNSYSTTSYAQANGIASATSGKRSSTTTAQYTSKSFNFYVG